MSQSLTNDKFVGELDNRNTGHLSVAKQAPRSDWSEMGEADHFVQFYETDLFLMNSLGGFISTGLHAGDGCMVVATREHRDELDTRLQAYGLDVAAAMASGQYISLDATETLSKFMVDGLPEPTRFAEMFGGHIKRAGEGRGRVQAFGEMVALLWAEGNQSGAIRLEELWNNLQKTHQFALFCAYPMNDFGRDAHAKPLGDVCAAHSRVIPAESYSAVDHPDDRLRVILQLQQKARALEAEIVERNEAEERLRVSLAREQMARAEAETANRMKDEFLATVSHELRTPLNAIIGWSHLLRSGRIDGPTASRAVETIERNARAQAQLIEDILDVSRVITGKLRLNNGPVDVASVINSAIDSVQLAADSKSIQLAVTLDPSARHVSGDASRLQQVVWNLLSNAIKFTPSGGHVEVRLEHVGSSVQISVTDTGPGITPDFLPFIFDRFRQADGTSTRRHGGLGLGLAIVRHLVELHGGTVNADSRGEGLGATFTIRLPLAPSIERAMTPGRNAAGFISGETDAGLCPVPSLDGVHVLLVDDDRDNLQILTVMLTERRANVQAASSVAQALEILEWYKPDVLVSDLAMPGEDGYSLISKVRALEAKNGWQIPAVALTAYVRVEDRARALTAGFNLFVAKPVEPNELVAAIANLAEPGEAAFGLAD
jgi:signal transduction histidine kinase/ActR/RegA family two-component response regulator